MANNQWNQTLARSVESGTALANTVTATSILPAAERLNVPSNLWEYGSRFRVILGGKISTASSSPGTFTLDCRVGSVIVFTATTPTLQTSQANVTWKAEIFLTVQQRGAGTATQLMGIGEFKSAAVSGLAMLPATSPALGTGFDNTVSGYFDCFGTWSVASASNTITVNDFELAFLN